MSLPSNYGSIEAAAPAPRRRAAGYVAVAVASGSLLSALAVWARAGQGASLRAGATLSKTSPIAGEAAGEAAAMTTTEARAPKAGEEERVAYADLTVAAACPDYDDDAEFMPTCPAFDADSWCATDITDPDGAFAQLCPEACADTDAAWAMPCAWMAIKSLPDSCAGTFAPDLAGVTSANLDSPGDLPNPLTLGGKSQLHNCDEHAVCFSCYNTNNPGTTDDAKYCEAVAAYYGGFGVPMVNDFGAWTLRKVDGFSSPHLETRGPQGITEAAGEIGANAAWRAINDDWAFWCDASTLAAIDDGTFSARYAPSSSA